MIIISCAFKVIAIFDFGFNMYNLKHVDVTKSVNNKWFFSRCALSFIMVILLLLINMQDITLFNGYFDKDRDTLFLSTKLKDSADIK